jgi:hypothetical protein
VDDEGRENDDEDGDEGCRTHVLLQNARGAKQTTPVVVQLLRASIAVELITSGAATA